MKLISHYIIILATVLFATSCSKAFDENYNVENPEQYARIYSAQASTDSIKSVFALPMGLDTTLHIYANYGGLGYPDRDIKVKFKVAPELLAGYNDEHRTSYRMMLSESYVVQNDEVTISKGKLISNPLKLDVSTAKYDGVGTFLLPITIESVEPNIKLNEEMSTVFFRMSAYHKENPFPIYDRSTWSIHSFSTEEWENATRGGYATYAIDDNNVTYWTTAWRNSKPGPPHWIAVDMGEMKDVHGLKLRFRSENDKPTIIKATGNPRVLNVETSQDGVEWTSAGREFELANVFDNVIYLDHKANARYFKITVTATHGDLYQTSLAEIYAF